MHGYIDPFLFTSKALNYYHPPAVRIIQADRIHQQVNHPLTVIYPSTADRISVLGVYIRTAVCIIYSEQIVLHIHSRSNTFSTVRGLQIGLCNQLIDSASRSEANLL